MAPSQSCAIGVMAKAPQSGRSKTRLCPPLSPEQAAALSAAFLRDITANIAAAAQTAPLAGFVAYAPAGTVSLFDGNVAAGTGFVLADGLLDTAFPPGVTGFGRCLLHAMRALLDLGFAAACLVNSDSPTLPTHLLVAAGEALLAPGDRVVLGPADDGGYYLIGMKQPHARLFADIAWSTDSVAATTRVRARELGLEVVELPVWYDVDDHAALARLVIELAGEHRSARLPHFPAAATAASLRQFGLALPGERQAAE